MMGDHFPEPSSHLNNGYGGDTAEITTVDADFPNRKRAAVLTMQRKLASLDPGRKTIERRHNVSRAEFLEKYYAATGR